ncbi:hypothetical protein COY95_01040, partial [Candidatus Woesearchaeota archaeon CG_4_10_14_0_8_um_filter_47_5]
MFSMKSRFLKYVYRFSRGLWFVPVGAFLPRYRTLVIADLHFGFEQSLNEEGVLVPLSLYPETKKKILRWVGELKAAALVLNGDIKHSFSPAAGWEWDEMSDFFRAMHEKRISVTVVKGNHDTYLESFLKNKGI